MSSERLFHFVKNSATKEEIFPNDDDDDYYNCQEDVQNEEVVEEINMTEDELLAMLDKQEDPLVTCRRLSKSQNFSATHFSVTQLQHLYEHGFVILDGNFDVQIATQVFQETMERVQNKLLKHAMQTKDMELDPYRDNNARKDLIQFVHRGEAKSIDALLDAALEPMIQDLNQNYKLQNKVELQLAYYSGEMNAYYEKHRDSLPDDGTADYQQRKLTCVHYCNAGWQNGDGGELKLFIPKSSSSSKDYETIIVEPIAGRSIVFFSGAIDHQVLPAKKDRVAITAWIT